MFNRLFGFRYNVSITLSDSKGTCVALFGYIVRAHSSGSAQAKVYKRIIGSSSVALGEWCIKVEQID